jgi:hypothetical protein
LFAPGFSLAKQNGYSRKIQNPYVNSKYVIPFYAGWVCFMLLITIIATMGFITNEAKL